MRLYLVQHGKAETKQNDPQRRLTADGRAETDKIAGFLKPVQLGVAQIWHSGKSRARETAEILNRAVPADDGLIEREGLSPDSPAEPIRETIDTLQGDLMIVAHLPFLSKLCSVLLLGQKDADPVDFRNAGIVCLERDACNMWRLRWIVTPELLP